MTALLRSSDEQLRFLNRAYDDTPTHLTTTAAVAAAAAIAVPPPIPPIESISRERKPVPVPVWYHADTDTENATTTTRSTTTTTSTGTLVTQQTNTVTRKDTEELRNTTNTTTVEMVSPILEKWMAQASQLALALSTWHSLYPVPSVKKPFVFFHLRKAGGSSIRQILYQSATNHNSTPLSNWIPCSNPNDPCMTFSLPPTHKREKKAIYASHFNYAHLTQLLRELGTGKVSTSTHTVGDKNFTFHAMTDEDTLREKSFGTCLTNIRPTVGRVRSCWDYRFVEKGAKSWTLPTAANMSAAEWKVLLPMAIDKYGNGCNNEMARAFGSTPYEHAVNHFSVETEGKTHFLTELEHVLSRMAGCVMVRVDRCEDSRTIVQHYLPWVQGDICSKVGQVKIGMSKVKNGEDLTTEVQEEILSQNKFDDFVFEFAAKLFDEQLRVATNSTVVQ